MASTTETGHAKNIANFQTLIEFVIGYGTTYNPSKTNLQLPALTALSESAKIALDEVLAEKNRYNATVGERQKAFSNIKTLSTRLLNSLQVCDASESSIKEAKIYNRKLQGKRATPTQTSINPEEPASKTISTSQQSFDQIIQHLSGFQIVLQNEPNYQPNEQELSKETLVQTITNLKDKNKAVNTASAQINNSRIARNKILYSDENNICETASEVKKYIKSVFGATSPEFAQIKGLEFLKIKI